MTDPRFTTLVARVIQHEGGYSDSPYDPGNWTGGARGEGQLKGTRWGISAASYPSLPIKTLPRATAEQIYKQDYYDAISRAGPLHPGLDYYAFDTAVNTGVGRTIKWLQRIARVKVDGVLGPITYQAVQQRPASYMIRQLHLQRMDYYAGLSTAGRYFAGWHRRSLDAYDQSLADHKEGLDK